MNPILFMLFYISTSIKVLDAFSPCSNTDFTFKKPSSIHKLVQYAHKSTATREYDQKISSFKDLLRKAAITRAEDPDEVLEALEGLEKLMRQKRKVEGESVAKEVLDNLTGEWRLIFTTGTKKTQDRFKTKINYFPLKAIQAFDATQEPKYIENAIYVGDFSLLKFIGTFTFDLKKSKVSR
jgi:hypothetical protein